MPIPTFSLPYAFHPVADIAQQCRRRGDLDGIKTPQRICYEFSLRPAETNQHFPTRCSQRGQFRTTMAWIVRKRDQPLRLKAVAYHLYELARDAMVRRHLRYRGGAVPHQCVHHLGLRCAEPCSFVYCIHLYRQRRLQREHFTEQSMQVFAAGIFSRCAHSQRRTFRQKASYAAPKRWRKYRSSRGITYWSR